MRDVATPLERPAGRDFPGILNLLRVSRLGLMVSHLWAYLMPAMFGSFAAGWSFWLGLVYVTIPLGLLIYGWNDYFDHDVDRHSPRKNSPGTAAVFGPSLSPAQLASLPLVVLAVQLPFALLWGLGGHLELVGWMALMALGNGLYNGPGLRLSRVPIAAELTATGIYLLIVWLGVLIHSPGMPAWGWVFAALSILNLQIMGTLVDRDEDAAVGKRTLSVAFGRTTSLAAVVVFLLAKAVLTYVFTGHLAATAVMLAGLVFVAFGVPLPGYRRSSSAYTSFIFLDWIWLLMMLLR